MEYLITYGWAILAIAIVMVSLYSLGIFNLGNLQPTATPGACQVLRTVAQTSLAGQCNNLIPKYVASFPNNLWPGKAYINVSSISSWAPKGNITITLFTYSTNNYNTYSGPYPEIIFKGNNIGMTQWIDVESRNNYASFSVAGPSPSVCTDATTLLSNSTWYQLVGTYNGSYFSLYVNGIRVSTCAATGALSIPDAPFYIGSGGYGSGTSLEYPFTGYLSNVQVYNTSLDSAAIKALYKEGIGGLPIDIRHLIGWWPLNGNANDYSGNNNQGAPTNVIWSANWYSTYTSPSS